MVSLKQIKYALAVEQTLHFRKAADACAVSQSALSSAVAALEQNLGFQVFERDNNQILVTPRGRQMLEKARTIEQHLTDLHRLANDKPDALSGRLAVGVIPCIGDHVLPSLYHSLKSQHPDLELQVTVGKPAQLAEQVRRGELDTAVVALPGEFRGLLSFAFWEEDLVFVTRRDDRLAQQGQVGAEQLRRANLMLLNPGYCFRRHALSAAGLPLDHASNLSATSLSTLLEFVRGGLGNTILPRLAVPEVIDGDPDLIDIPLQNPGPHRRLACLVRPSYPSLPDVECFMGLIREQLRARHKKSAPVGRSEWAVSARGWSGGTAPG